MALSVLQKSGGNANNAGTVTVSALGATPTLNNILAAWVAWTGATRTCTSNHGYTALTQGSNANAAGQWFWKVAGASESTTPSWTLSGSADRSTTAEVHEIVIPAGFVGSVDVENCQSTASGTSHSTPSVTPTVGLDAMALTGYALDGTTTSSWSSESTSGTNAGSTTEESDQSNAAHTQKITAATASCPISSTSGSYSGSATSGATAVGAAGILVIVAIPMIFPPFPFRRLILR